LIKSLSAGWLPSTWQIESPASSPSCLTCLKELGKEHLGRGSPRTGMSSSSCAADGRFTASLGGPPIYSQTEIPFARGVPRGHSDIAMRGCGRHLYGTKVSPSCHCKARRNSSYRIHWKTWLAWSCLGCASGERKPLLATKQMCVAVHQSSVGSEVARVRQGMVCTCLGIAPAFRQLREYSPTHPIMDLWAACGPSVKPLQSAVLAKHCRTVDQYDVELLFRLMKISWANLQAMMYCLCWSIVLVRHQRFRASASSWAAHRFTCP